MQNKVTAIADRHNYPLFLSPIDNWILTSKRVRIVLLKYGKLKKSSELYTRLTALLLSTHNHKALLPFNRSSCVQASNRHETLSKFFKWLYSSLLNMMGSYMYTANNMSIKSWNILLIFFWNVAGVLHCPIGIKFTQTVHPSC